MTEEIHVVIVGAGIIGIAVAAYLSEAGIKATLIDRDGICEGTSSGNAAAFAFSDILPLAHKGMMCNLPRWLADPLGPLSVPPAYLPQIVPWLLRFWRAGSARHRAASIRAQRGLMRLSEQEWQELMSCSGTGHLLREDGSLELYESEAEFDHSLPGWAERKKAGIAFEHVRGTALTALQPGLNKRFVAGTFVPGWKTVADPKVLADILWDYARSLGAGFVNGTVTAIKSDGDSAEARLTGGQAIWGSHLILAAGAWSHILARQLGDRIPLETERGYNTTLPKGAFDLKRQLIFSNHGFVITPLQDGIRVGGAVELAGLKRPPDYRRAKAMLKKAADFLPGLKTDNGKEWMGFRPSLPDSLPVIGFSRNSIRVIHAFGHGHLGLTQAAATGRLVRDMVLGQDSALDLAPFSPQRF